jgi:hypothetical protein
MFLVPLGAAVALFAVDGSTTCPTPAEVAERLGPLLDAGGGRRTDQVTLSLINSALVVELRDASGAQRAERRLALDASCADLASAAAIVIASWQSGAPSARPGPVAAALAVSAPAGALRYDVGASFLTTFNGDFAWGASVDATLGRLRRRWAGRLGAFGTSLREQRLGSGRGEWTRAAVVAGPRLRFAGRAWLVDLDADALIALLYVRGAGFSSNQTSFNVDPGLAAGARVGVRVGPVAPVLSAAVVGWLRPQELDVVGDRPASLPQWELQLAIGFTAGVF